MDNDDNGENTNRLPKPPYPEGLKETDNLPEKTNPDSREPEGTNVTDASVGESYRDALWRLPAEAFNSPVLFWACEVCPDRPEMDKGEEESAICNICKNNMELFEVADWMPPLPM